MRVFALGIAMLSGCTTTPYAVPPQIEQVTLAVKWMTPESIRTRCGADKVACATVGSQALPYAAMWVEKPTGFDDQRTICALGHELMHALGARH